MYTLVLNASEGILQFLVAEKHTILVHQEWDSPKHATEKLSPLLQQTFAFLDIPFTKLTKIACVVGAGSFTGIRLCLATAAALARVSNAEQVPIDYLQALAFNGPCTPNSRIRVLTHAKRNLVHCADFIYNNLGIPLPQGAPLLLSPEESANITEESPHSVLGSGLIPEFWEHKETLLLPAHCNHLNPQVLLHLALTNTPALKDLDPQYVRTVDAVDNLEYISKSLGNDPQKAFQLLDSITKN